MATYKGHSHDYLNRPRVDVEHPVNPSTPVSSPKPQVPASRYSYNGSIGRYLGKVNEKIDNVVNTHLGERLTMGNLNKTWRALILLNRAGMNPAITSNIGTLVEDKVIKPLKKVLGKKPQIDSRVSQGDWKNTLNSRRILVGRDLSSLQSLNKEGKAGFYSMFSRDNNIGSDRDLQAVEKGDIFPNDIMIINPCLVDEKGNPQVVILQNRPYMLDYQPQSSWADIKSIGRNTPMYHYTGSETTLQFNTSWYMPYAPGDSNFNLYWVINQCRKLESWTMANGYLAAPPYLMIRWGDSDMFSEHLWILHSATYKLSDFHDKLLLRSSQQVDDSLIGVSKAYTKRSMEEAKIVSQGLVPFSATQELIFKRVSGINLWYSEIAPNLQSLQTDYSKLGSSKSKVVSMDDSITQGINQVNPLEELAIPDLSISLDQGSLMDSTIPNLSNPFNPNTISNPKGSWA